MGAHMTHAQFLRIKKLTGKAIIQRAAKHNLREIAAEIGAGSHIDPARIANNVILFGPNSADGVARTAQALMDKVNVRPLKITAVRALEVIFSLPSDTTVDQRQFFDDATRWAGEHFSVPVLSATIHNDEDAPHCHVLLLPLVNGRMVGSDLMGGRAKLQGLQAAFHDKVGRLHGLTRQMPQKRHSAAVRGTAIELAFDVLDSNSGLNSAVLRVLLEPHTKNPEPLLMVLGLTMPVAGSFVATMTRPTKKDNPIGKRPQNPIGIGDVETPKNGLSLSCVGIGPSAPSCSPANDTQPSSRSDTGNSIDAVTGIEQLPASESPATMSSNNNQPAPATAASTIESAADTEARQEQADSADTEGDYTREHDDDHQAEDWDESRGEFARKPVKVSCKPAVIASVRIALEAIGRHGGALGAMRC
jgi:hypothetical protein